MVRVFIDQLSANTGSRQVWLGLKRGGVGSEYRVHLITQSASIVSAVTSIFSYYGPLPVADTDVLKVYVIGVAGDTTTTDIITEIWEENYTLDTVWTSTKAGYLDAPISTVDTVVDAIKAKTDNLPTDPADESLLEAAITAATSPLLRPTVEGRTLDVTATGAAGIDWANIENKTTVNQLTNTDINNINSVLSSVAVSTMSAAAVTFSDETSLDSKIIGLQSSVAALPTAAANADAVWDEVLSGHVTVGTTGKKLTDLSSSGVGAVSHTITVNSGGSPLDGADVWVTTDISGSNVAARGTTNAFGQVTFFLDAGTYYGWKQLNGYTFTNPTEFTVE